MNRTKFSLIAKLASVSFLSVLLISRLFFIPVTNGAPIALTILVFSMFIWVLIVTKRLPKVSKTGDDVQVKISENPLPPLVAARTVAFALAGSRAGAILLGSYLAIGLSDFSKIHLVAYSEQAIYSAVSAVLSGLMILISIWLERKCSPPTPK